MRHQFNRHPFAEGGGDRPHGSEGHGCGARAMRGEGRPGFARRGFGPFGEGGFEGRGRRRMFESGELRLVLLLLIEREPRHGYDLIRDIETRTGGAYAPSPGIVYPTLTLLEDLGYAEARASEGAKKLYAITPTGTAHLNDNRKEAEAALARLDALGHKDEALDSGPVVRAMANLRATLWQRLSGQTDKQIPFSIADAIDEAARKIERL